MNTTTSMMYYGMCEIHLQVLNQLKGTPIYHSIEGKHLEDFKRRVTTKIENLNTIRTQKGIDNTTFFSAYDVIARIGDNLVKMLQQDDLATFAALLEAYLQQQIHKQDDVSVIDRTCSGCGTYGIDSHMHFCYGCGSKIVWHEN